METHPLPEHYGTEILRVEVGSTLHGTGLPGKEDHDEMGIFVEHPRSTIGLDHVEHYIWRSAGGNNPSQPGDTDLTMYTLRKWAKLALNGNPSVLLLLWAPDEKIILQDINGVRLRARRDWFSSKRAGLAFLGYMEQQRQRMVGQRGKAGRVRIMPDGGVDWKYAMHMLRLGYQGVEFLTTGQITLPIPGETGDFLRSVRRGEVSFDEVISLSENLEQQTKDLLDGKSALQDQPREDDINAWIIQTHLDIWDHATRT